jgi:hypothetical protein
MLLFQQSEENMDGELIVNSKLFRGIAPEEAASMLHCLQAVERRYPKGALICRQGEPVPAAGLLLSGEVHIVQSDLWGNQSMFSRIGPGELFSEAYAALPGAVSLVNAVAAQESRVLLLSVARILHTCPSACAFHARLIRNLLACAAEKNLHLAEKITHTAPKTIRGRVLSYLSAEAIRQGKHSFRIPFSRQQLADYLGVERSALSAELGKMQRDGLIEFRKDAFTLKAEAAPL